MPGGTGAMTIADGLRNVPRRRRSWKWFLHALVFLSLIGLQVHQAFERGPRDTVDAGWYIGYALSILHEQRLPPGTVDVVPLYPLWLTMWMRIDPGYRGYLQCLRFNLPYWSGEKVIRDGDTSLCRHLDNAGFYVQALLGAIGTGLIWLAGWLVSGRPMVAHLSAFFAVYAGRWLVQGGNAHVPESLVIPLFAGVNVCLAWLVLSGIQRRARLPTAAVAVTCGLLLGALALVRPPYEFLLAALPAAATVWMLRDRPRRRAIAVVTAWVLVSASLVGHPLARTQLHGERLRGFHGGVRPLDLHGAAGLQQHGMAPLDCRISFMGRARGPSSGVRVVRKGCRTLVALWGSGGTRTSNQWRRAPAHERGNRRPAWRRA